MRGLQIWIYTVQIVLLGMNKIMQESLLLVFDADFFRDVRIFCQRRRFSFIEKLD